MRTCVKYKAAGSTIDKNTRLACTQKQLSIKRSVALTSDVADLMAAIHSSMSFLVSVHRTIFRNGVITYTDEINKYITNWFSTLTEKEQVKTKNLASRSVR
jgi:hypothetical protein